MQLSLFQTKPPVVKPLPAPFSEKVKSVLGPRLPPAAVEYVVRQIAENPVSLKVVSERTSKSGDFRPSHGSQPSRITVNGNLNPYAFLITLVHELAHYYVYRSKHVLTPLFGKGRKRYTPHGREWKETFRSLMWEYQTVDVFPADVLDALFDYMQNPTASTFANQRLMRELAKYDEPSGLVTVESLPDNALFQTTTGRRFRKIGKKRTRYLCYCLDNRRQYLFSPIVQVIPEETGGR